MLRSLHFGLTTLALSYAAPLVAQTLDTLMLTGGHALTITLDQDGGLQTLRAGDTVLATASNIARGAVLPNADDEIAAAVFRLQGDTEECPPAPMVVSVHDGVLEATPPLGRGCTRYDISVGERALVFVSPPDLHAAGDAFLFDLDRRLTVLGPIGYRPQPTWGWDRLSRMLADHNDAELADDLYAHAPVFDALLQLWDDELFLFAQHLAARTFPTAEGDLLYQSGCVPGQCTFAIGLLVADPATETVYAAYFNEGAPDVRPPVAEWSEAARELFERWRSGDLPGDLP
ncbi:MAG: hypothetical protein AAGH43_14345 [Pseudomonadota bacterium]